MKPYLTLLLLHLPSQALSLAPDNLLLMNTLFIEEILSEKIVDENFEKHQSSLPKEVLLKVLTDTEGRIHKQFKIPPSFKERVIFWAQVYTQCTSEQVLIHDRKDLSIVYDAIGRSRLPKASAGLSPGQKARKQAALTHQTLKKIKKSLLELSRTKHPKSKYANELRKHLIKIGVRKPKGVTRRRFFSELAKNVRVQTGQRDKIFQGILSAAAFDSYFTTLFKAFKLPHELIAIAFVESSFNPNAISKVGATGVWQIMPFIEQKILPRGKALDTRRSISCQP